MRSIESDHNNDDIQDEMSVQLGTVIKWDRNPVFWVVFAWPTICP